MKKSVYPKIFRPTKEMLRATQEVVAAMAWVETVKPIVKEYESEILAKHQYHIAKYWVDAGCEDVVILDPDKSYKLEEEDFTQYYKECQDTIKARGLKVSEEGNCPLLEAEHYLTIARNNLINIMEPITHISLDDVLTNMDNYYKLIDINLNFLVPYISYSE